MQIIVSSINFGEWLKNEVVFAKDESIKVDYIGGYIVIQDLTDTDRYSLIVKGKTDRTPCNLKYSQLVSLEKFLLCLKNQPITIIFDDVSGIECKNFTAKF